MPAPIRGPGGVVIREMTDAEMIADGRRHLIQIKEAIQNDRLPGHKPYVIPPNVEPHYRIAFEGPDQMALSISTIITDDGGPVDGYYLVYVTPSNLPSDTIELPYWNYVHEDGRVLVCANNMRNLDTVPKQQQNRWSDLIAASCVATLALKDAPADGMKACSSIWRDYIVNPQTMRLIDQLVCGNAHRRPFEVAEEDDLFFALVASDNGRGIASLLRDYPWMFGFKTIVGAFIVPNQPHPSLYWRLKEVVTDIVPDTPDPSVSPFTSKKDKRKYAKRMSQG